MTQYRPAEAGTKMLFLFRNDTCTYLCPRVCVFWTEAARDLTYSWWPYRNGAADTKTIGFVGNGVRDQVPFRDGKLLIYQQR